MCHSSQVQISIPRNTVERVHMPMQAGNARAWLLGRWRAAPASLSEWPLWTETVENRNTQTRERQARWGKDRWINAQGREKEKHTGVLHASQLFSNSTAACHCRDEWMGSPALLGASYCCFYAFIILSGLKISLLGSLLFMFYVPSSALLQGARAFVPFLPSLLQAWRLISGVILH